MVKEGDLAVDRRGIIGRVLRIKEGVYYGERWDNGARWQTVEPRFISGRQVARMLDEAYGRGYSDASYKPVEPEWWLDDTGPVTVGAV